MQSAEDASARELEEHWRLLYVALTRAEERLLIAGSLGKSTQAVPEDSWHAAVEQALMAIGGVKDDDGVVVYGEGADPTLSVPPEPAEAHPKALQIANRPSWLDALAPQEARPPRPLSPSALTEDTSANPPPNALMQAAAERGRLLHALFERLPGVALDLRVVAADQWLSQAAGVGDANTRAALIADALKVIEDLAFADVFSPKALAEAPVAGVVDGIVIAGTVDRLLVTDTTVTVIDFKTARRVPHDAGAAPESHLQQMAAYVAVLQGIFPAHDVRAALLYTSGPILLTLDPALMAQHKPSFQLEQHILGVSA
jgi:ATP-dependent helicase/nuclease subunit A